MVATGMPFGSCRIERRASIPERGPAMSGIPITGHVTLIEKIQQFFQVSVSGVDMKLTT
jgi:hypothetical protein